MWVFWLLLVIAGMVAGFVAYVVRQERRLRLRAEDDLQLERQNSALHVAKIRGEIGAERDRERAEVKRLTNIIIRMRKARQELPPEATDEHWGRYVVDETKLPPEPEDEEAHLLREMDREVLAEIQGSLVD